MGEVTAISWCDHTFNPWIGCMKVSPACDGCYAEALMDKRYGKVQWGAPGQGNGTRVRTSASNWHQPIKWDKKAKAAGARPFVFCSSLADVFDNQIDPAWRRDLFALISATPYLVWLLLTKRPQNIVDMARDCAAAGWPVNAAIGTTVTAGGMPVGISDCGPRVARRPARRRGAFPRWRGTWSMEMAAIKKVMDWRAKRASASITVDGFGAKGDAIKITGIPVIEAGRKGKGPIVSDKAGNRFELVSA